MRQIPSRAGLESIIAQEVSGAEKTVWSALASGYSGLADLSVPSWLLAALLVRPGGRIAIVAPATCAHAITAMSSAICCCAALRSNASSRTRSLGGFPMRWCGHI